jgi:hypothetical protein
VAVTAGPVKLRLRKAARPEKNRRRAARAERKREPATVGRAARVVSLRHRAARVERKLRKLEKKLLRRPAMKLPNRVVKAAWAVRAAKAAKADSA